MNVLLINHYAGSPTWGMEFRPYYLAREWVRQGHTVTIAAASFTHLRRSHPAIEGPNSDVLLDGIRYRFYATPTYRGNGLGRWRNVRAFLDAVARDAPTLTGDPVPDVVVASSTYPFDVAVARDLARRCGATLVYEVHDLWPLSLVEVSGMSRWHPFVALCGRAERAAYRDADLVVSMLPKVHGHMVSKGLDPLKLHVVPNGVAPEDWLGERLPLRDDVQAAMTRAATKGYTIVGYAGSMGLPNALDVLIDAAILLKDERFAFVLVGEGSQQERLQARAKSAGLSSLIVLPSVSKAEIPSLVESFDIAYLGWQRQPIYRFGIAPNKLMDYMMAGRAVLHSVEAGNDPVADAECGLTVAPEDPVAVAQGLRRLAQMSRRERGEMGARGRAYVQAYHAWPMLARRFMQVLESARAHRTGPAWDATP